MEGEEIRNMRGTQLVLLDLKMEEGAQAQEMWALS